MFLLLAMMLFSACGAETAEDIALTSGKPADSQAVTTDTVAETTAPSATTQAEVTEEAQDDVVEAPVADEAFADLLTKYPIVSELTGSFASANPVELIEDGFEKAEAMKGGVIQMNMTMSMDMGMLGSQEEKLNMTLTQDGDDYRSVTESVSTQNGETYTERLTTTYVGETLYSLTQLNQNGEELVEKYKVSMSADDFKDYIAGDDQGIQDVSDADIGKLADMIGNAIKTYSGMTEEGECVYFAKGFNTQDIGGIDLFTDMTDEIGTYLSDNCLDNIALVVTLDQDGSLKSIYIDMPIEISIEEGEFSMNMGMSIQMELSIRELTEADHIEVPEDADSYETRTFEDLSAWIEDELLNGDFEDDETPSAEDEPAA